MFGIDTANFFEADKKFYERPLINKRKYDVNPPGFQNSSKRSPIFKLEYPDRIEGYKVIQNLGSGAFAKVVLARNRNYFHGHTLKEMVALKMVNLSKITESSQLKAAKKEFLITSKLKHPNVVEVFHSFEENLAGGRHLILVVEYMSGGTLEQYLHNNLLSNYKLTPEYRIWHIFHQISSGIAFMHSQRCLHRDLKPANILMGDNFLVKISDFGLSRMNSIYTEEVKTICGTPYYLSPERTLQTGYTYASDVWSLGCMLYELSAGVNPFFGERDNRYSLSNKITEGDFPPLPESHYSYFLINMIDNILVSDPIERPPADFIEKFAGIMVSYFRKFVNF